jgi:hypothetical protein
MACDHCLKGARVRVASLWISSIDLTDAELRPLFADLRAAIPECEPRFDSSLIVSLPMPQPENPDLTRAGVWFELVALVLPAATGALVSTTVDVAVDWLRGVVGERDQKFVLIYGPDGEELRMIRLRGSMREPKVFKPPWPELGASAVSTDESD